jgi:hypothetical protein
MPGGYTPPVRQRFEETCEALSHRFSLQRANPITFLLKGQRKSSGHPQESLNQAWRLL